MNVHFSSVTGAVENAFWKQAWEEETLTRQRGAEQGLGCGAGRRTPMRKPEQSPEIE